MPVAWTAEKDQRLLLVALEQGMINNSVLAAAWKTKYPTLTYEALDDELTESAIRQHLNKLRNNLTPGGGGGKKSATSTPKTPRTKSNFARAPKTPTSSAAKRKKVNMSDEDNSSSDERELASINVPIRQKSERRSKTPVKSYRDSDSSEDEADDEGEKLNVKAENGDAFGGMGEEEHGNGLVDAGRDDMSEVSAFEPAEEAFT